MGNKRDDEDGRRHSANLILYPVGMCGCFDRVKKKLTICCGSTLLGTRAGRKENEDGAGTKRVIISNKKGGQRRESGKFDWKSWSKG